MLRQILLRQSERYLFLYFHILQLNGKDAYLTFINKSNTVLDIYKTDPEIKFFSQFL